MIEYYNAFISYRHVPRDMKVAEEIQKELEHFKIPKEITYKTGITKIERIFRDKSELPISSNLTDDIKEALANSEYLIVICSTEALKSLWIKREIELFLETHPQERVLTVLSEGEPEDVIPDRLKFRKIQKKNSYGKTISSLEPVEPLSCDYRMSFPKARKEELPRLAAALLGCSYDELVQRANQYRMRRLRLTAGGVFAVSAAAVSYLVWSNAKIKENYEEAQRNMSLNLADAAFDEMDNQDRISAIQNALDAMPDEEHEKPLIAEAEYALTKATGVYDIPGPLEYSAVRRYEAEYPVLDFLIGPTRETMAAMDREANLYIWDLSDNKLVYKEQLPGGDSAYDLEIASGDEKGFYVSTDYDVSLRDWKTGEIIWSKEVGGFGSTFNLNSDHSLFSKISSDAFYVLNQDGEIVSEKEIKDLNFYRLDQVKVDPAGKQAILVYDDVEESSVAIMDLETSDYTFIGDAWMNIDYVDFDEDGNVLICELANDVWKISEMSDYDTYKICDMTENICKVNVSSGETIWQTPIRFTQDGYFRSFEPFEYSDDSGTVHKELICNTGSVQTIIDLGNGKIQKQTEWPAAVINTVSKSGTIVISLLKNGDLASDPRDDDVSLGIPAFVDDSAKAIVSQAHEDKAGSIMVLPYNKPYIILYEAKVMPPKYKKTETLSFPYLIRAEISHDVLAAEYHDDNYSHYLSVYNWNTEDEIVNCPLDDYYDISWELSEDGETLYLIYRKSGLTVKEMSLKTGNEHEFDIIPDDLSPMDVYFEINDHRVYYGYTDSELITDDDQVSGEDVSLKFHLVTGVYDMYAGKNIGEEAAVMDEWDLYWDFSKMLFSKDGRHCLVEADDFTNDEERYKLYLLNAGGDEYLLDASDQKHYYGVFNQTCTEAAVAYDDGIRILDFNSNVLAEIPFKKGSYLSMQYLDDELFLLTNEQLIYRYSSDYKLLRTYDVGIGENKSYYASDQYSWQKYDDSVYLKADDILNIVDLDQSQTKACIEMILDYNADQKIVILEDYSEASEYHSIIKIPIYSAEELIETGRKMLSE